MRLNFSSFNPQPQPVRFGETFLKTTKNGGLIDNFGNTIREGGQGQGSCGGGGFGSTYEQDKEDYERAKSQLENWGKPKITDNSSNNSQIKP